MNDLTRRMPWSKQGGVGELDSLLTREWLVTNGLGGYASGTVSGITTRRYHGLLIAALPAPLGRMLMLKQVSDQFRLPDGRVVRIGGEERGLGEVDLPGHVHLTEFRLESGLPVWRYEVGGYVLEKQVVMPHMQNTVHVIYRLVAGEGEVRVEIVPSLHFRHHEGKGAGAHTYTISAEGDHYEVSGGPEFPTLRLLLHGERAALTLQGGMRREIFFRMEADRGYDSRGILWSPGFFTVDLSLGREATLVASTEPWHVVTALLPREALQFEYERRERLIRMARPEAREPPVCELVLAADQFIISPAGRVRDAARARASGDEVRTVIAGYHWFTDWGRDTMISLEGLTLITGRTMEAGWILRTFAHYVQDGLIPNMFPDAEDEGLYHTADATLWFFHAIDRYLAYTGDRETLRMLLPKLRSIVEYHLRGTRFCIGVDRSDGLLRQGLDGYQLTWMDAKVDDWVVTPRRGKAVELNGLWYNALRLMEGWVREEEGEEAARPFAERAEQVYHSFNARFWYESGGYLYDVVDGEHGDDPALRPNQLLAFSLRYPVLAAERREAVLKVVTEKLLTPLGLRSLSPDHPEYKSRYFGDLRARDAAYHQGTVWAWLIGPFVDAWLTVYPDDHEGARRHLLGFIPHLGEACIGSIAEIFDAEPPFIPRGCIAQAWSVAEVLRCWVKSAVHR